MNSPKCNDCKFCKDLLIFGKVDTYCCRHAPTEWFPRTLTNWWCGEWQPLIRTIKDNNI